MYDSILGRLATSGGHLVTNGDRLVTVSCIFNISALH